MHPLLEWCHSAFHVGIQVRGLSVKDGAKLDQDGRDYDKKERWLNQSHYQCAHNEISDQAREATDRGMGLHIVGSLVVSTAAVDI